MAVSGTVLTPKPVPQPPKPARYVKGFITGSIATLVLCTAATYFYLKEEINKKSKLKRAFEICKYGFPERPPPVINYTNHVLAYDPARKTPIWVAEHLRRRDIEGTANRRFSRFQPDPNVEAACSATNEDYWNSGWSRGHLAPAGNNKNDQEAMNETFYLTNVIPQDVENNTGFWNRFEIYCRDLTKKFADVRVVTGCLYLPTVDENKKRYVKYEVIGENNVAVPTHLYKIIVAESADNPKKLLGAFMVPNTPLGAERDLTEFQVSLQSLEKQAGVKFFKDLDSSKYVIEDLCKHHSCKLLSKIEFARYYLRRKLEGARTLRRVEKVWEEIQMHGLKSDVQLEKTYHKKKEDLSQDSVMVAGTLASTSG